METAKIPKPKWNKTCERNSGHTCDEWGMEEKKLPRVFIILHCFVGLELSFYNFIFSN